MRVDNGQPLGNPDGVAPPALALWLIGIDIDLIWNKPACPQQNARVEKMQHTTSRWAEVSQATSLSDLAQRLVATLLLQRETYPVSRLGYRSRLTAFPQLEISRRVYQAGDFDAHRVYGFVSRHLYVRKVSKAGQIYHFGSVYSVGRPLRYQWVQLRLTSDGTMWEVLVNYEVVNRLSAHTLVAQRIETLTVFQQIDPKLGGA